MVVHAFLSLTGFYFTVISTKKQRRQRKYHHVVLQRMGCLRVITTEHVQGTCGM